MVNIEIDGKPLQVEPGSMIIEAADDANIYIPRFCYHRKLSIAANCRMCLVEVEKSAKPLPACATPVTEGMKVFTRSEKACIAQKAVMEFLLINHPLDCPVCDQGGECELQDLSMGYGRDHSCYNEKKRSVNDDDLGPLIASDMTRCIHCTRCVRFGQEIAGQRELGATNRGENMEITTYVKHTLTSELSGNIIDLCPVGALTSKPYRFKARAWELKQQPSIAAHDCIGSNISIHTRRGELMRVVPRENETINENWLSDRDRFSYLGLMTEDRLQTPKLKVNGEWSETDWTIIFPELINRINGIINQYSAEQIGAIISPSATLEEQYLWQKIWRALGCNNLDHRLHQVDFSDDDALPLFPKLPIAPAEVLEQECILLIGSNIAREQPIAGHWVRQASLRDAQIFAINPIKFDYHFDVTQYWQTSMMQMPESLAQIVKVISDKTKSQVPSGLENIIPSEQAEVIANKILTSEKKLILLGALAQNHPEASKIRALIEWISQTTKTTIGFLTEGANSAGAWLAGVVPHRLPGGKAGQKQGLNINEMFSKPRQAYVFFGLEPELDCIQLPEMKKALESAELVIAFSAYETPFLREHADILIPIVPFSETDGTFVNVTGHFQNFKASVLPYANARPGWKILRVLGNYLHLENFDFLVTEQIVEALHGVLSSSECVPAKRENKIELKKNEHPLMRITEWPLYRTDGIVRRSSALQEALGSEIPAARLHSSTAQQLELLKASKIKVKQGHESAILPLVIDNKIFEKCVWIPAGFSETACLGDCFGPIEIVESYD
ncbi:MAG: NADH-quinone oxidoreductase subunit NuoG [Gammaproteobacteria bacterium]